ncbi:MAG: MtnX-like HAD-IB family phosphatase [Candidatus Kapabacteria bacterium]|jgi:2,3-diketo-5-methylthio-1-phosphopentane phosphatase|nr:MtnX-like HAD-IB family phosphatase [Candidatus Kapabacteria bacterium]
MLKPPIHIFTDFDGTITIEDLGDKIFDVFGAFSTYYPQLTSGLLTVPAYWQRLAASIHAGTTLHVLRSWALEQPADTYFRGFVDFCQTNALPLTVVSDGFDVYIDAVLEREGAANVPRYCNRLQYNDGVFMPEYPGRDESCTCFCASCKRNNVLRSVPPEALIVYIGDGYSDFCAAEHADIIFAKKALAAYCNRQRLPHYPFTNFADVKTILEGLLARRRLKYRHQAMLKRKEAFETE